MRKSAVIFLVFLFVITLNGCSSKSTNTKKDEYAPIQLDNKEFTLAYNKIEYTADRNGKPVALIYFTFTNKTDKALSMLDVYLPDVFQDGIECDSFASLDKYPDEFNNRDREIKDGASIYLCISFVLKNTSSELEFSIHDNY
jgi:uncharacterized protein YceK